jgi:hypothetical protein
MIGGALVGYFVLRLAAELISMANQGRRTVIDLPFLTLWVPSLGAVLAFVAFSGAAPILTAPAFGLTLLVSRLDGLLLAKSDESINHIMKQQRR